jgi:uncharacterized RDD family membrane protein YckC
MFCAKCGTNLPPESVFCSVCGEPVASRSAGTTQGIGPAGPYGIPAMAPSHVVQSRAYAGFWLRFVAFIIDTLILLAATGAIFGLLRAIFGVSALGMVRPDMRGPATMRVFGAFELIVGVGAWLYFALMESSGWQATLGKKLLGLYVTDLNGQRIGFGRATGRYFAKIISNITLFIGYIMAGLTGKKQAMHDMIAGCLVWKSA